MIYLDSAGAGLPPLNVTDAMKALLDDWSRSGEHWDEWLLDVVETRKLFAQLIGASAGEVGVVPSVSHGLAAIASSLDLSKRRKVVTSSLNFPTNIVLWRRMEERGLLREVVVLQQEEGVIPIEAYERAIDDDTAVVSVDYVSWLNGYRERVREISEIAHRHGALLLVDGFHALGVFPVDVKGEGIDVLVSGFYKWLCGPHGVACIYVDQEILDGLEPAYIGWHGIEDNVIDRVLANRDPFDRPFPQDRATPSPTAARFEWGTWPAVAVKGAVETLKFTLETNPATRFQTIRRLTQRLIDGLQGMGARIITPYQRDPLGAGIVTIKVNDHIQGVRELHAKRIIVSGRYGHLRISPHFYNTPEEIEVVLEAIRPMVT
jgi:selenocysteine lyase/cysteine desulfurase